jgi:hypothetical protein
MCQMGHLGSLCTRDFFDGTFRNIPEHFGTFRLVPEADNAFRWNIRHADFAALGSFWRNADLTVHSGARGCIRVHSERHSEAVVDRGGNFGCTRVHAGARGCTRVHSGAFGCIWVQAATAARVFPARAATADVALPHVVS